MGNQLEHTAYTEAPRAFGGGGGGGEESHVFAEAYADMGLRRSSFSTTPESATPEMMAVSVKDVLAYSMSQEELDAHGIKVTSQAGASDSSLRWANESSALRHLFQYMPAREAGDVLTSANQQLEDAGLKFVVRGNREVHLQTLDGSKQFGSQGNIVGKGIFDLPEGQRYIEPYSGQKNLPEHTTLFAANLAGYAAASVIEGDTVQDDYRQQVAINRMGENISQLTASGASTILAEANRVLEQASPGSDIRFAFSSSGGALLLRDGEPQWSLGKPGTVYVPRHWGRQE